MTEIAVVATFVAKPGNEEKLKELLQGIVAPTLAEPGAIQYDLHRDIKEPRRFVFFERWASEASLAEHNKTSHIQALGKRLPDLIEHGEINVVAKL
ncbi:antibiotic biosynthesis monooxygenase [Caballeronia sordidicola]|uniref:Antibiotic biosynthesis monooxygenase n=1 Tax=Caballeronia sordidicola TaxID=196367 RepID=A0A158G8I1_CABSO|nr:putative quinol monooxygenase [Caballeronia sordidicola]SAL28366.1 antibiotic biosynthesis monooxygenase [Caballeronia sordidicola]